MTVTVNNGFFIPNSRLNFIEALVTQTSGSCLLAIEGPSGIGKTTVLEELLTSSLPNANKCYLTATATLNEIQIRSRIIEQLFGNVLFDPEKSLLTTFLEFNHQTPLMLAVDNGHFLPGQIVGEILQVVAELKKRGHHMVAIITYDKSQSKTIGSIDSALISHYSIPSLDYKESYQLLARYFENIPSSNNVKIKRWIENANGNPIQLLAFDDKESLKFASVSPMNIKLWVSVVIVASLLFALGLYFYRVAYTEQGEVPATIKELMTKTEQVLEKQSKTVKEWPKVHPQEATQLQPKRVDIASAEDIFAAIEQAHTEQAQAEQNIESIVEAKTPVFAEKQAKQVVISGNELEVIEQKAFDTTLADAKEEADEAPTIEPNIVPQEVAGYLIDNQSLMTLPSDKYVLQLTAVSSESTLAQYLESKKLDPELTRIYKIRRSNADWLVVTYGVFDSISTARETAKTVDPNAWAKSVSVIQQQIAAYQQSLSQY